MTAEKLGTLLCVKSKNDEKARQLLALLGVTEERLFAVWEDAVSFSTTSSRHDKLQSSPSHECYRQFLIHYRQFDADNNDITKAEFSDKDKTYGVVWEWMFENCWMLCPTLSILSDPTMKKKVPGMSKKTALGLRVGEQVLLTPELLAYFDSLVATSPWSTSVSQAERKTGVLSLNDEWIDEHASEDARKALQEVFTKHGW